MVSRSLSTVLLLAALAGSAFALGDPSTWGLEKRMFELVNQARRENGLPPFQPMGELCEVARAHSQDMAQHEFFNHRSPRTGSPFDRIDRTGLLWRNAGENIALDQTVDSAHDALMHSPGHRANILSEKFTHIGIGVMRRGHDLYFTQNFLRPRHEAPGTKGMQIVRDDKPRSEGFFSSVWRKLTNSL